MGILTDSKLKTAKPTDKDYKLPDGSGLYLLIKKSGTKSWRYNYRFFSKQKTITYGLYPQITLKDARGLHESAQEQLSKNIDPAAAKQQQKQKHYLGVENSFGQVADRWVIEKKKAWSETTAKRQIAMLNNDILPYLAERPIDEIETYELAGCLKRVIDRDALGTARKVRIILNQICAYAKQYGLSKHNPASDLQGIIPSNRKAKHQAAIVEPQAFGRFLKAIDRYQGMPTTRTALQLAPLVFQRPGELCGMEWNEVNFDKKTWTIPQHKKKERNQIEGDHVIPLSQQALALLEDIYPLTGRGQFVFPNQRSPKKHMCTEALGKAIRSLGYCTVNDHTTHGFRASARTMLDEQLHQRVEWIEAQLAHQVKDSLGNAYNRTKHLSERTEMMQRWADYLDKLKNQHTS